MGANARVLSLALPPNLMSSVKGHLIQVCVACVHVHTRDMGPWIGKLVLDRQEEAL